MHIYFMLCGAGLAMTTQEWVKIVPDTDQTTIKKNVLRGGSDSMFSVQKTVSEAKKRRQGCEIHTSS